MNEDQSPSPLKRLAGRARWLLRTENEAVRLLRETGGVVLAVLLFGLLLYAAGGVWPPMVAVESPSMEPHVHTGDLVLVMEEHRLSPDFATADTGVVTYRAAAERGAYRRFGEHGDVIVFDADGGGGTPTIHRAHFWVEADEDWYDKADPQHVRGGSCEAIANCPAPHSGFVTKGDGNPVYDQDAGISEPVRPSWIRGEARGRIPWLGHVRLAFEDAIQETAG